MEMKRDLRALAVAATLLLWYCAGDLAFAQKQGGSLRVPHFDSPASMSLHEESTVAANRPLMGVFNNLVMFDQHVVQNSPRSIVPDLATSWSWNEEGTELTLLLRQGVRWHDGKPFTAKDVQCTWELLTGKSSEQLRINPRKGWYNNLDEVTANGDFEVTFHLKRAQPSFLSMLASGWSAVYPCHVPAREMRQHPIGTGPFKFVEFRPNQSITVTRNSDYWKQGLPYLDGIEWTIIKDLSTRTLAFVAGKGDLLYGVTPDVEKNRAEAREIMQKLGYGADKRLPVTVSTRDVSYYRDPAVILIDQLKEIYMDGELAPVDTTNWYPKVTRKDYTVGMNITESEVDDPDVLYYENYACGAARNYTAYCNPDLDKLINQQSIGTDLGKRKQIVWQIERKLVEDNARPVIFFPRGAVCRQPSVKSLTLMVNSIYNGQRFEDLWLDK
jgi:ABC-type transport system substrate-binding protein